MNYMELVKVVSYSTGKTQKEVDEILHTAIAEIKTRLQNNEEVSIRDFGSFDVRKVKVRKSRDVNTGIIKNIPSYLKVKFRPGKNLKEIVRNSPAVKRSAQKGDEIGVESFYAPLTGV